MPEPLSDTVLPMLHFVRPEWLLALPLALLLAWRWQRHVRTLSRWLGRIDAELLPALLEGERDARAHWLPWLMGAGLAIAAVGLAGPSFERVPQPVESANDAVVVVLDLSLSMLAEDVQPSRLVRARQKIADLLRLRPEGSTALIVYAGNAHTVVPLTTDSRTIENLLPALTPAMMPIFGSELGDAIDLARDLLGNAGRTSGLIIAITDGIDREADVTERSDPGFPVAVLGVGTDAGGSIPLGAAGRPDQVLRTQQGETIIARLDPERLQGVAEAMHGQYATLGIDDRDLNTLLDTRRADADATTAVDRTFDLWADRGYWVTLALLPLLLLGFRRGALACLTLVLAPPPPAVASLWDDLWQRPDQRAYQHLIEGTPERAAREFEDSDWRAAALYRAGEHMHAAEIWAAPPSPATSTPPDGTAESAMRAYNRGNALAQAGQYEAALEAYDAALAAAPDDADAAFNRNLVARILEQQAEDQRRKDPGQEGAEGEQQQGQGDAGENPATQSGTQQANPDDTAPADPEDADAEPGAGQRSPDDRALAENAEPLQDPDALEQWLRRVPDDPGGLLRRKFQHETNQRLRRGEYRARDPEKIW